jgi:hydroxymethylglutaryl-CoA synthase
MDGMAVTPLLLLLTLQPMLEDPLVRRDAPLALVRPDERATHAANVWDFFKPDHNVEYPTVDGALSQTCYYQALEDVYTRFTKKIETIDGTPFHAETPDYWVFHAPYNKLVQKSYARLFLMDARRQELNEEQLRTHPLAEWLTIPIENTYSDRNLESVLKTLSARSFQNRLVDANAASREVGNTYTASVFLGLSSLVDRVGSRGDLTPGKTIVLFSYGSGALASMYRLHV